MAPARTSIASALSAAFLLGSPEASATQTVTNCADSGTGSLRAAIANAPSGDTIAFNSALMACSTITLSTGALAVNVANLTLSGPSPTNPLTIDANHAQRVIDHQGTGLLSISSLTLANGYVITAPANGGCVNSRGSVILANAALTGCRAYSTGVASLAYGGGVYTAADLTVRNSTITDSRATIENGGMAGGGIGAGAYAAGNLLMQDSTVSSGIAAIGGGVGARGNVTLERTTLSGNFAAMGTALALTQAGNSIVAITNSTLSGNLGYYGCVLYPGRSFSSPTITISNSTIAFNTSTQPNYNGHTYAAGLCAAGTLNLQSTIIANNHVVAGMAQTPSDFSAFMGVTISGANDLIVATLGSTTPPPGTLSGDPLLAPLGNNGSTRQTHALQAGSPALGAGNNTLRLASDERGPGFARMTGESTDIGALQSGDGVFACGFE